MTYVVAGRSYSRVIKSVKDLDKNDIRLLGQDYSTLSHILNLIDISLEEGVEAALKFDMDMSKYRIGLMGIPDPYGPILQRSCKLDHVIPLEGIVMLIPDMIKVLRDEGYLAALKYPNKVIRWEIFGN